MKRKIFLILTITLLSINTSFAQGYYAPDEQVNISVYEKISPAIVAIERSEEHTSELQSQR